MVALSATRLGIPYFPASAAVCLPMQQPTILEKSASGRLCTNPRTVDALVKVTMAPDSTSSFTGAELGASYTVS